MEYNLYLPKFSASFYKFCSAFWTSDTYFSLPSGNTDLLFALRAGIDMKIFSLLLNIFLLTEEAANPVFNRQIFLVFRIPLADISGKHTDIDQYDQEKLPRGKNHTKITISHKKINNRTDQQHNHHKHIQPVCSISSCHKFCKFLFHNTLPPSFSNVS